jgi:general secretion pathway protein K
MASSGIHAAMAMLVKDKMESNVDSLQEDWANSEKINEILQSFPFEDGKITVKISDELGRNPGQRAGKNSPKGGNLINRK